MKPPACVDTQARAEPSAGAARAQRVAASVRALNAHRCLDQRGWPCLNPPPDITVQLVGGEGNAYAVLGRVRRALREARVSDEEASRFTAETTSGDYDHVLRTCMIWVNVA